MTGAVEDERRSVVRSVTKIVRSRQLARRVQDEAGELIAYHYQLGYGVSAFAAGRLRDTVAFVIRRLLARRADVVSASADCLLLFSTAPFANEDRGSKPVPSVNESASQREFAIRAKKAGTHRSCEPLYLATEV